MAASTLALSGTVRPPRLPSSCVITALQSESVTRSAMAVAEKPPKITEWIAPIRAQASIAATTSGVMPM